jgi:hypothetical protein
LIRKKGNNIRNIDLNKQMEVSGKNDYISKYAGCVLHFKQNNINVYVQINCFRSINICVNNILVIYV